MLCTYLHEHLIRIIFDIIFENVLETKTEINENNAHGREHKTKENVQDDRFQYILIDNSIHILLNGYVKCTT